MGLDGGTYITRSDVLRGQSWDMATADNSRSTRGGTVNSTLKRKKMDAETARLPLNHVSLCVSHSPFTIFALIWRALLGRL